MKHVLFVIPPGLGDMAANHEASSGMGSLTPERNVWAYPPQTVALCASAAAMGGWSLAVLNGAGQEPVRFARQVAAEPAGVLAVQVSVGTAESDLSFLRLLRQARGAGKRTPTLLFGPSAGRAARGWLGDGPEAVADALLTGEPEMALIPALERAAAGEQGEWNAFGLAPDAYSPAGLLADLDRGPFVAWDRVPWQPYEMVSLLSSRGCAAGCAFCPYVLSQGDRFRAQSPERTAAEWSYVAGTVHPPYLIVRDPVFAQDRSRVAALCEQVARQGSTLGWACESRPEHFDRDLIRIMKAAGCATIKIGMESGDPALLARLGRVPGEAAAGEYLEQIGRVARWCEEAGVRCRVFVMAGMPGQAAASVDATVAALKRVAPWASVHPNVYRPYEGVPLTGTNQPVPPETLARLRGANRAPSSSARVLGRVSRVLGRVKDAVAPAAGGKAPAARVETGPASARVVAVATGLRQQQYLLAGSRVFITGGSGFVGGYVARALVAAGAQVLALVRPGSPPGALAGLPVEIVRGDLTQPSGWLSALDGCRFCFHTAALYAGPDAAHAMYASNTRGTGTLLAACARAGVARFVHTSTVGTVGRPAAAGALPDERTPFTFWDQASHYVRSKRLGELIAQSWNGAGLEVVIVKPTAPVGAGDGTPMRPPTATGRRILAVLQGEPTGYPPGGANHAPVKDIAAGHLLAAERGAAGETYILGHCHGNLDQAAFFVLVSRAAAANGLQVPHKPAPKPAGSLALTADPSRAVAELGLPQSDLPEAFAESVGWYRATFLEESQANARVA